MGLGLSQLIVVCALYAIACLAARVVAPLLGRETASARFRYTHLDGLRGVAAIGVVACHINQHVGEFLGSHEKPLVGDHVGILCVQMFFALTAFLFTDRVLDRKLEPASFFLGRIGRIVPMYLVVVLGTIATALAVGPNPSQPIDQTLAEVLNVLKFGFTSLTTAPKLTLLGLNALALIGMAWTLSYEWVFYLILIPAATFCTSRIGIGIVLAAGAAFAWGDFYDQSEMVIWPFFLPGVVAAVIIRRAPDLPQSVRTALAFGAIPIIGLVLWSPTFWTMPKLLLATALFLITLVSRPGVLNWPALQAIGKISYSIYLLQYLVIFNMTNIVYGHPNLFGHPAVRVGFAFAMIVLIVLIATATYRLIELPGSRWTKSLGSAALALPDWAPRKARGGAVMT